MSAEEQEQSEDVNRLMILTKEAGPIKSTAAFLNRRDVEAFVTHSLQDVIDRLSKGWSRYVLLSLNYPHPKVDMLPKLLQQSFSAEVMVFAETSDRKTSSRLSNSKAKQVIFGSVSGPVVLMRLRQLQKELAGGGEEESAERAAGVKSGEGDDGAGVRISGSGGANGNSINVKGGSSKNAAAEADAMSRFMKALSNDEAAAGETPLDTTDLAELAAKAQAKKAQGAIVQKGSRGPKLLAVPPPTAKQKAAIQEAMREGRLSSGGPIAEGKGAGDLKSAMQKGVGAGEKKSAVQPETPSKEKAPRPIAGVDRATDGKAIQEALDAMKAKQAGAATPAEKKAQEEKAAKGEKSAAGKPATEHGASAPVANAKLDKESLEKAMKEKAERDKQAQEKAQKEKTAKELDALKASAEKVAKERAAIEKKAKEQKAAKEHGAATKAASGQAKTLEPIIPIKDMTLMQKLEHCARVALFKTCGKPREQRETLLEYRACSVLVVTTKDITGSVLIAVGSGAFKDEEMLKQVEIAFIDEMTNCDFEIAIGQLESFGVNPPSSAEGAFMAAEFCAVSRSDESEVGIAFLSVVPAEPAFNETHDNMLEIDINAIEPDVKLEFEVFLYMPVNGKYLRYLKEGSSISGKQSSRLKENKVSNLYLNKADKEAYRQHATVESLKKQIAKKAA